MCVCVCVCVHAKGLLYAFQYSQVIVGESVCALYIAVWESCAVVKCGGCGVWEALCQLEEDEAQSLVYSKPFRLCVAFPRTVCIVYSSQR